MSIKQTLTLSSKKEVLFYPDDIFNGGIEKAIEYGSFNIYLICKRKKYFFSHCDTTNSNFNISHFYSLNENHEKVLFSYSHSKEFSANKRNNGILEGILRGNPFTYREYAYFNACCTPPKSEHLNPTIEKLESDLKVLYIGQSIQTDVRLKGHSNLNKVLGKVNSAHTSEEILIIVVEYEVDDFATFNLDANFDRSLISIENLTRLSNNARERLPLKQEITLYEASLIRYFQTEYNIEYKSKFPSKGYPSYKKIFDTNFNYTAVELDTWDLRVRLYTDSIKSRFHHTYMFSINSETEKRELFNSVYDF